ncbi:hypothetical protein [Rhizobium leguminosarum]|uniref:DUF7768 domain-containing protein n=1 Tax=Rhizobium leguminosarum TaxID=384 RepID=UPI001C91D693|nr:hypothetical protein [Rhizobium leguminosarum]
MRPVIIESPYAGDIEMNVAYARAAMWDCLERGEAPYASHLLFTQVGVLDDSDAAQRARGIEAGLIWGRNAAATVVYTDRGISTGMQQGIDRATAEGRPIEYRSLPDFVLPHDQMKGELAAIGQSVMNWIDELTQQGGPLKDWTPAESPAEVIPDLYNMLEESFACHRQACGETKVLAAELEARNELIFPRELTDDLRDVLSMMMWNTGPIAHALRAGGADIPTKAELEQAHVLHWLTLLVLEHGSAWREKGEEKLKEIRATLTAASTEGDA